MYEANWFIIQLQQLPSHCQSRDLKDLFRTAGRILCANVALELDGRSRGFGTVVYGEESDAAQAIHMFNGFEYDGHILEVNHDQNYLIHTPKNLAQAGELPSMMSFTPGFKFNPQIVAAPLSPGHSPSSVFGPSGLQMHPPSSVRPDLNHMPGAPLWLPDALSLFFNGSATLGMHQMSSGYFLPPDFGYFDTVQANNKYSSQLGLEAPMFQGSSPIPWQGRTHMPASIDNSGSGRRRPFGPRPYPHSHTKMPQLAAAANMLARESPSDHQLGQAIRKLLQGADLSQLTKRMVRRKLEDMFGVDMTTRKDFIKSVINRELSIT